MDSQRYTVLQTTAATRNPIRSALRAAVFATVLLASACTGAPAPTQNATVTPSPTPPALSEKPLPTEAETRPAIVAPTVAPTASPTPSARSEGIVIGGAQMAMPSVSSAVAVTPNGEWIVAVNPDSDSVTIVDARTLDILAEVGVGDDPRTLAITPDSAFALVANHAGSSVSVVDLVEHRAAAQWVVGAMPYGVVTDGVRAYVAEFALGHVAVVNLAQGGIEKRITVGDFPSGLGLTVDGRLLVTHHFTGAVTTVDTSTLEVGATVKPRFDANLAQSIALTPDGTRAFLPLTRPNATNPTLLFDTTVFPVVSAFDVANGAFVPKGRVTLDTADRPVNMPFASVVSPDGSTLYVANAGSNDVSVIDLATGQGVANIGVGDNPRGIAVTADGARVVVNNTLSGTLTVISTASHAVEATVRTTTIPLPPVVLLGKKLFNAGIEPKLTTDNWISCAVCHFDGMTDNRTWLGFPDGPRNTPSLFGVGDTAPFHWSGDLDELHDVELTVRVIQGGTGLIEGEASDSLGPRHAGRSAELDAMTAYLETLKPLPSPVRIDPAEATRGRTLFAELGCGQCHAGPAFTDGQIHDVGTGDAAKERNSHGRGTRFDTPTLRGLWLTAPYLHDGSAPRLQDVFTSGGSHDLQTRATAQDIEMLIAYLFTLP